ncbi:hypothetical protein DYB36_009400 [Aphanomyces astaci]|uniref:Uncharacterized protein n=1 Tax=Aphanomyces astaci TaxID=112090 RepID=A0A397ADG2_APHAT|nr:hypothetical protein DYB36_009400 [Aphanomyces astaci]
MDVLDASYDSVDEVDEDAELELSCALQDLTTRCKSFSAKMTDEIPEIDDGEVSEDEDLAADAKARPSSHQLRYCADKHTIDDDDDDYYNQTHDELTSIQCNIKQLLEKLEDAAATPTPSTSVPFLGRRQDLFDDNHEGMDEKATPPPNRRQSMTTNQRQEK